MKVLIFIIVALVVIAAILIWKYRAKIKAEEAYAEATAQRLKESAERGLRAEEKQVAGMWNRARDKL